MRKDKLFWTALGGWTVCLGLYGLARYRLGVDLTDEGAHLAWPMRIHLGDAPFSSELLTLVRPIEDCLSVLFGLHPKLTLYEFRMLGWLLHLGSLAIFARLLFSLGGGPVFSVLAATVPIFAGHLFGIAAPSYNTLASDFLLMALSLWALPDFVARGRHLLGAIAGGVLFLAVLAHPGLGLVAAALGLHEAMRGGFFPNLIRRRPSPTNLGLLVLLAAGAAFLAYFLLSGAAARWIGRMELSRPALSSGDSLPLFLGRLLIYPFQSNGFGTLVVAAAMPVAAATWLLRHSPKPGVAAVSRYALAVVLAGSMIATLVFAPSRLTPVFAATGMVLSAMVFLLPGERGQAFSRVRFLVLISGLATLAFASLTYYFSLVRSWVSGVQGMGFAFGVGLVFLVNSGKAAGRPWREAALLAAFGWLVAALAGHHYRSIYRDGPVTTLTATFEVPRLRGIRSSPERVRVLNALYAELRPRLKPGDTLIAYDSCPLIYYLLDARPAYGMAWAERYGQQPETLARLNAEMLANPLPAIAVRSVVAISNPDWANAPRINYAGYPLNDTVMAHYELEQTIHPFEIWRLKSAR